MEVTSLDHYATTVRNQRVVCAAPLSWRRLSCSPALLLHGGGGLLPLLLMLLLTPLLHAAAFVQASEYGASARVQAEAARTAALTQQVTIDSARRCLCVCVRWPNCKTARIFVRAATGDGRRGAFAVARRHGQQHRQQRRRRRRWRWRPDRYCS